MIRPKGNRERQRPSSKAWGFLAALASSAGAASAQTTRLLMEASVDDGQTWASEVTPALGQVVYFRVRAQLVGATALGFLGATYQPTMTNWSSGVDEVLPFTFPGLWNDGSPATETEYVGRPVSRTPQTNAGRIFPFGASGQSATSASGLITFHEDPGNVLRFAGSKNTTPTTNVFWGVSSAQNPPVFEGFDSSLDVVVFRFGVIFRGDSMLAHEARVEQLAGNWVRWILNSTGTQRLETPAEIIAARVLPGPGVVSLCGACGLWAARRRRGG